MHDGGCFELRSRVNRRRIEAKASVAIGWPWTMPMKFLLDRQAERMMAMSEATWQRHANPWSAWTRFLTLPFLILAIWSRVWLGWWSLSLIGLALLWVWLNPRVFPKPVSTDNWASRIVLGERLWLERDHLAIPPRHQRAPHLLTVGSMMGLPFLIWGLWALAPWPTLVGLLLTAGSKLWFADRMVWLYTDMMKTPSASTQGKGDSEEI
jgi:hypothetical protein